MGRISTSRHWRDVGAVPIKYVLTKLPTVADSTLRPSSNHAASHAAPTGLRRAVRIHASCDVDVSFPQPHNNVRCQLAQTSHTKPCAQSARAFACRPCMFGWSMSSGQLFVHRSGPWFLNQSAVGPFYCWSIVAEPLILGHCFSTILDD